jgi:predicted secreted protein
MYRKFDVTDNFFCIVHFSSDLNTPKVASGTDEAAPAHLTHLTTALFTYFSATIHRVCFSILLQCVFGLGPFGLG